LVSKTCGNSLRKLRVVSLETREQRQKAFFDRRVAAHDFGQSIVDFDNYGVVVAFRSLEQFFKVGEVVRGWLGVKVHALKAALQDRPRCERSARFWRSPDFLKEG
jgi:hypothetical protein